MVSSHRLLARRLLAAGSLLTVALTSACAPDHHELHDDRLAAAGIVAPAPTDPGFPPPPHSQVLTAVEITGTAAADDAVLPTYRPSSAAPAQAIARVRDRGRLIVGIDPAQNRLSFRDPATGRLAGFEVELAQQIARDVFGSADAVEFRFLNSAAVPDILAAGEVDMVIRVVSMTQERARTVTFSAPYLTASKRLLVSANSPISSFADLDGRRVCAVAQSTAMARLPQVAPAATVLAVPTWSDCLVALQQHQADAVFSDDAILAGMIAQEPSAAIVGDPATVEHYGIALPLVPASTDADAADRRLLVEQVNATIARILADGTWQEMYDRWFGDALVNRRPPAPVYGTPPGSES